MAIRTLSAVLLGASVVAMAAHVARQHRGETEHASAWHRLGLRQQRMISREMLLTGLACLAAGYLVGTA